MMERVCIDHDLPLNPDGTCPVCRDSKGKPFVLDMQSYYLRETKTEREINLNMGDVDL